MPYSISTSKASFPIPIPSACAAIRSISFVSWVPIPSRSSPSAAYGSISTQSDWYAASTSSLRRKAIVGVLVVGALDQADGRLERQQGVDIGRGAAQVGLQADADVRVPLLEGPIQVEGGIGVGAPLHVEPQQAVALRGVVGQAGEQAHGRVAIEIQAQLGRLDADLGIHAARGDLVEQVVVVIGDRLGLGELGQVLSEAA